MDNSILVADFINHIWNNRAFEKLNSFLHPGFKDYSLPTVLQSDKEGTKKWIINTGVSFEHHTIIEDLVTEGDKSIIRIKMHLKHIGPWRKIEPTGMDLDIFGYRHFRLKEGKILEHWALMDGQSIEDQLKNATYGCKIAQ